MENNINTWMRQPNTSLEYYVEANKANATTYQAAKLACEKFQSILASVNDNATQLFLERIIPQPRANSSLTRFYWIGAHRASGINAPWLWQDNSTVNYSKWSTSEPSNDTENCVSIFSVDKFRWYDNHCETNDYGYVCQRDVAELTTTTSTSGSDTTYKSVTTVLSTTGKATAAPQSQFPVAQVVAPIAVALILLVIIIAAVCVYKKRRQQVKWSAMATDRSTEIPVTHSVVTAPRPVLESTSSNNNVSVEAGYVNSPKYQSIKCQNENGHHIPGSIANPNYEMVQFDKQRSQYVNYRNDNETHQKPPSNSNQVEETYVDIYSTSSKARNQRL
ncbi:uncharacterized protein LOC143459201 isoform X2 [Clavelina lepadiformis]|uniref:uncharacterized protein LOC143459201 isoform X2 n=1 Tax=Clavelina lepadiformis TaxID=159417 RepID=UPI00404314A8